MGGCGTHSYRNISQEKINMALEALSNYGATIAGNNPWTVDTRNFGVKISARWNPNTLALDLTVTDSDGTIPCSIIWSYLDNTIAKYRG